MSRKKSAYFDHIEVSPRVQNNEKYSEVQQSDTYCPSIEKALFKQHKLEQLLAQNQLKKMGLEKAETLIKVLILQLKGLQNENRLLKTEINDIKQDFIARENELCIEISFLQAKIQYYESKISQERHHILENSFLPHSSRKLSIYNQKQSLFSQQKSKQKVNDSPIKRVKFNETISKEYVEFGNEQGKKIYEDVKSLFLSDQIEKIIVDFQDITTFVQDENKCFQNYMQKLQQNNQAVKQLSSLLSIKSEKKYQVFNTTKPKSIASFSKQETQKFMQKAKRLFNTQYSNEKSPDRLKQRYQWQDNIKQSSIDDEVQKLFKEYEDIIQQYKQYSAYLKAYLCSCISFISKQGEGLKFEVRDSPQSCRSVKLSDIQSTDRSNCLLDFSSDKIFDVVYNDIILMIEERLQTGDEARKELQRQNKELRNILDELVLNLKQMGVYSTNIKEKGINRQVLGSKNKRYKFSDHNKSSRQSISNKEYEHNYFQEYQN